MTDHLPQSAPPVRWHYRRERKQPVGDGESSVPTCCNRDPFVPHATPEAEMTGSRARKSPRASPCHAIAIARDGQSSPPQRRQVIRGAGVGASTAGPVAPAPRAARQCPARETLDRTAADAHRGGDLGLGAVRVAPQHDRLTLPAARTSAMERARPGSTRTRQANGRLRPARYSIMRRPPDGGADRPGQKIGERAVAHTSTHQPGALRV